MENQQTDNPCVMNTPVLHKLTVGIPVELHRKLKIVAAGQGWSMQKVVAEVFKMYLEDLGQ